jgi:hypothetical protein
MNERDSWKIRVSGKPTPMVTPDCFDPFTQRAARDIRNTLSEAFAQALERMEPRIAERRAAEWLSDPLPPVYRDYVVDRQKRYRAVFQRLMAGEGSEPHVRSLLIWNQGLFFEFHECLEDLWRSARGPAREALQGLILAAGTYIHLHRGFTRPAERLAAKSVALLERHRRRLTFIANLDELRRALATLDPVPPKLQSPVPDGVSRKRNQ